MPKIYIKIDGIKGSVTDKDYKDWIEASSLTFDANRLVKLAIGNASDREAAGVNLSEITITKPMDMSTPHLFHETCVGKSKASVQLVLCQTGDGSKKYMEYTLSDVLISKYEVAAKSSTAADNTIATPMESVKLNFKKIEMKYTPYDAGHNAQSPIPAGYDLSTAQKV